MSLPITTAIRTRRTFRCAVVALQCAFYAITSVVTAQPPSPQQLAAMQAATKLDHEGMMQQLHLVKMRPGPSGDEKVPNHANYDESIATPSPRFPELLRTRGGQAVKTADQWWKVRRPEIVDDLEREVYGRIPANVPMVTWRVAATERRFVGAHDVVARQLIGHADNSAHPDISVDIALTVVVPANSAKAVPVLMMFGRSVMPAATEPQGVSVSTATRSSPADLPATQQLIAVGWGYVAIDPSSIQVDNGAGRVRGIIGLTNEGQARTPEQWGALRAWAWGAARALDYLETDPSINAKQVGIEGVSRFGKAALAWRQHDGGHTDAPNVKYFIEWANRMLKH